ncbi:MAG: P-loop NTPase [Acholeplasma sp.]|nr:P-loop NTPase [Acholeplasma sp.]
MATYEELKIRIETLEDPGYGKTLKEVNGIKKLTVGPTGVVDVELYFSKPGTPEEQKFKINLIKLVKVELGFPGIKVTFHQNEVINEREKKIIYLGIASGKGGVGKSTVTANLAAALNRLGKKVGIMDADIYGASIPQILRVDIKPLSGTDDDMMIPLQGEGMEVISTEFFLPSNKPIMWRGPMLGKMLSHYFGGVAWDENTDYVLIDLPPGTGDVALDINKFAKQTKMLIVTTPHVNAAHVAVKAGLGAQQIGHQVIGVVENMSYFLNTCNNKREFIFGKDGGQQVAEQLGVDVLAQIPIGQPVENYIFKSSEPAGLIYDQLASKVIDLLED